MRADSECRKRDPTENGCLERPYGHPYADITERRILCSLQGCVGHAYATNTIQIVCAGMLSPLLGIAGVNSLLFAAYGASKRLISPFGQLSLKETAAAGALAGAINAVLASPGMSSFARFGKPRG